MPLSILLAGSRSCLEGTRNFAAALLIFFMHDLRSWLQTNFTKLADASFLLIPLVLYKFC